jgi:hypothetical protein
MPPRRLKREETANTVSRQLSPTKVSSEWTPAATLTVVRPGATLSLCAGAPAQKSFLRYARLFK